MPRIHFNNFRTTLNGALTNVATSATFNDNLPAIPAGDFVYLTLYAANTFEIISISSNTGAPTYTIARAQEGTSAIPWDDGSTIECRVTADSLDRKQDKAPLSVQTASSSASLNFINIGNYAFVEFIIVDLLPATDDVELWIRTSTNNGSSYDSGASDYGWAHLGRTGGTTQAVSTGTDSKIILCQGAAGLDVSNVSGEGVSGSLRLYNPTGTTSRRITHQIGFINGNGAQTTYTGTGSRLTAADVDAVQFLFSSGNIASGTIYLLGYPKN